MPTWELEHDSGCTRGSGALQVSRILQSRHFISTRRYCWVLDWKSHQTLASHVMYIIHRTPSTRCSGLETALLRTLVRSDTGDEVRTISSSLFARCDRTGIGICRRPRPSTFNATASCAEAGIGAVASGDGKNAYVLYLVLSLSMLCFELSSLWS